MKYTLLALLLSIFSFSGCTVKEVVQPQTPNYEKQHEAAEKAHREL